MPAIKIKSVGSLEGYISLVEKLRSRRSKRLWFRGCGKASHKGVFVEVQEINHGNPGTDGTYPNFSSPVRGLVSENG